MFVSLLDLLKTRLKSDGLKFSYLTGQTKDRQQGVEEFQNDPGISVFILDPWWNPAGEAQAIDRTHQIEQKRRVFAYRIIAKNIVEEKIIELQKKKKI